MDRDGVQSWLDRYAEAWRTYDPDLIGDLFSEEAEYRSHPWDEPIRGREAIVQSWIAPEGDASGRDEPGTYDGRYAPCALDGDRAVAVGESLYWKDSTRATLDRVYENVIVLDFDGDGRCRSYTEWYMKRPG